MASGQPSLSALLLSPIVLLQCRVSLTIILSILSFVFSPKKASNRIHTRLDAFVFVVSTINANIPRVPRHTGDFVFLFAFQNFHELLAGDGFLFVQKRRQLVEFFAVVV